MMRGMPPGRWGRPTLVGIHRARDSRIASVTQSSRWSSKRGSKSMNAMPRACCCGLRGGARKRRPIFGVSLSRIIFSSLQRRHVGYPFTSGDEGTRSLVWRTRRGHAKSSPEIIITCSPSLVSGPAETTLVGEPHDAHRSGGCTPLPSAMTSAAWHRALPPQLQNTPADKSTASRKTNPKRGVIFGLFRFSVPP